MQGGGQGIGFQSFWFQGFWFQGFWFQGFRFLVLLFQDSEFLVLGCLDALENWHTNAP